MNSFKITILEHVAQCDYPSNTRDYIANAILEVINNIKGCKFFKIIRQVGGKNETITVIRVPIPTLFGGNTYTIQVLVYLPKTFPYIQPEVHVEKTSDDMGINPNNKSIDPSNGKIMTRSLMVWNSYSSLINVMNEVSSSFNNVFPVFQIKQKQQNQNYVQPVHNESSSPTKTENLIPNKQINSGLIINTSNTPTSPNTSINSNTSTNSNISYTNQIHSPVTQPYSSQGESYKFPQIQNPNDVNEVVKMTLIQELRQSLYKPLYERFNELNTENHRLQIFKNEYSNQIQRYKEHSEKFNGLTNFIKTQIETMSNELVHINNALQEMSNNIIDKSNFMKWVEVHDENILKIISIEATLEDTIGVVKKGFERGVLIFCEVVKFIRLITREVFKARTVREKLLSKVK